MESLEKSKELLIGKSNLQRNYPPDRDIYQTFYATFSPFPKLLGDGLIFT